MEHSLAAKFRCIFQHLHVLKSSKALDKRHAGRIAEMRSFSIRRFLAAAALIVIAIAACPATAGAEAVKTFPDQPIM